MKAQTEVLGFVMVVLLVTVGLLFIVSFMVLNQDRSVRSVFTDKQLAINLNDAILTSSSSCNGLTFDQLIVDCAEHNRVFCNGYTSCTFLEDQLSIIFNSTLAVWGKDFRYTIYDDRDVAIINPIQNSECLGDIEPGVFYLPVSGRTVFARLDICGE